MNEKSKQNIMRTTCIITMNTSKTLNQSYRLTRFEKTSLTTLFLTLGIMN